MKAGTKLKMAVNGILSLVLLLVSALARAEAAIDQSYRLGAGDEVEIRVYGEDDLLVRTRLGDSGVISYPFLGEIVARGLTVSELEQLIVKGLKGPYLLDPIVSVNMVEYRPFFLNGEVTKPGAIPFQPGITLRKAIAIAGGFTERANRTIADVLRSPDTKSRAITLDEQVRPGDIITIKQSFF
ncbi:MAG: Polysaccharide export protein [Verrucomicrobiaceae bacterium]|nr:Polysaccharide export protein [Verrucomicrobiaceae bacterium]